MLPSNIPCKSFANSGPAIANTRLSTPIVWKIERNENIKTEIVSYVNVYVANSETVYRRYRKHLFLGQFKPEV
jgi:hypothetical protein